MAKLILHIGPGKCGSSSIQQFFASQKHSCIQNTRYKLLSPSLITKLNHEEPNEVLLGSFIRQLSQDLEGCDDLVLSHEFLFRNPYAIKTICISARHLAERTTIIGYSRRQSNFLVSAYSQWLFRSTERIIEVNKFLAKLELDPALFTGLERQLIASIENDFYSARLSDNVVFDWSASYDNIYKLTQEYDVLLKCGILPNKESDMPLIQDFCLKADLTLHEGMKNTSIRIVNASFDHDVIEAINNAITLGHEMMGPNEGNDILELLSSKVTNPRKDNTLFVNRLMSYVDAYFWESNQKFCEDYGLDQAYFIPSENLGKKEVIDMIVHEYQQRSLCKSNIIEGYRILAARMTELCVQLGKLGSKRLNT